MNKDEDIFQTYQIQNLNKGMKNPMGRPPLHNPARLRVKSIKSILD